MANHPPAARRRWQATIIITLFILAVAGAAFTGWRFARYSAPHQGPIVLISIDGLRADALASYGARPGATPNIDALAQDGIVFERAYTHSPLSLRRTRHCCRVSCRSTTACATTLVTR